MRASRVSDRAEAERLRTRASTEGTLEIQGAPVVPAFAEFMRTTFTEVYIPCKCRPATRERYAALFGRGIGDRREIVEISRGGGI
jgi:hypothetical protein